MKKLLIALIIMIFALTGCAKQDPQEEIPEEEQTKEIEETQTGFTVPVPEDYLTKSNQPGTVQKFDYSSKDFLRSDTEDITRTAYVYLPYNYDPNDTETRYNVLYLMHGWYGYAGDFFEAEDHSIKNLLDHLTETGEIKPTIVVAPSFYTNDSTMDFTGSTNELNQFHRDFVEYLMPAVESSFKTYATSTSPEDLMASRNHRAFGGFSLGAVTAWNEFCYDSDYVYYYLPLSGSCWYFGDSGDDVPVKTVDFFEELIEEKGLNDKGYFIYAATGTDDFQRGQLSLLMSEMLNRDQSFSTEQVQFFKKDGGQHDMVAVREYLYNSLPLLFKNNQ